MSEELQLGKMYRDSITGLQGIAISVTEFLYACKRVGLQQTELIDGKTADTHYFDQHQVEEVEPKKIMKPNPGRVDVSDPEIELGAIYRDSITGFEGVATSVTRFLYSNGRVILQSTKMRDGKPVDPQAFDSHALILVKTAKKSPAKKMPQTDDLTPGGPGGAECPPRAVQSRQSRR